MKYGFLVLCVCILPSMRPAAQVVYTDVDPDSVFSYFCPSYPCGGFPCLACGTHGLDLDNNGAADFNLDFNYSNSSGSCMGFPTVYYEHLLAAVPLDSHAVATASGDTVRMFSLSDTIGPQCAWSLGGSQLIKSATGGCGGGVSGVWADTGFAGLKLVIGGAVHFGWARMFALAQPGSSGVLTCVLLDYAYQGTPNQYILAGDTGSVSAAVGGMPVGGKPCFFPNPASTFTTLRVKPVGAFRGMQCSLYSPLNEEVLTMKLVQAETEINVSVLSPGIYMLKVCNRDEVICGGRLCITR